MKKLRKLSRKQKIFLQKQGLDPEEYLLERQDCESYTFYYTPTGIVLPPMRR